MHHFLRHGVVRQFKPILCSAPYFYTIVFQLPQLATLQFDTAFRPISTPPFLTVFRSTVELLLILAESLADVSERCSALQ